MRNDVISTDLLRSTCYEILNEKIRPIHYSRLTDMVVDRLDFRNANTFKIKEDLRERILQYGNNGIAYTGKPYYMAYLKRWVYKDQLTLNTETIEIPLSVTESTKGACEAIFRFKYMKNKYKNGYFSIDTASYKDVEFRVKRLIIEQNVSYYFKERWPKFWMEPSNYNNYKMPASDDFRMKINRRVYNIDVCTPGKNDMTGKVLQKNPAHLHIIVKPYKYNIEIQGFITGKEFKSKYWKTGETKPINQLIFWFNCMEYEIPYNEFKK